MTVLRCVCTRTANYRAFGTLRRAVPVERYACSGAADNVLPRLRNGAAAFVVHVRALRREVLHALHELVRLPPARGLPPLSWRVHVPAMPNGARTHRARRGEGAVAHAYVAARVRMCLRVVRV